jgi:GNAT superfamily N-acetyltransferase
MSTLKISGCMSVVKDMSDLDRDALLARLDQYRADGVPVERAQIMAAADTLAELEDERREFMRLLKEQHPEIFTVTAPEAKTLPRGYVGPVTDEEREQGLLVGRLEDESNQAWSAGRKKVEADTTRRITENMRRAGEVDEETVEQVARTVAFQQMAPGREYDPETHPYFQAYREAAEKVQSARAALQEMRNARIGPPEFESMRQLADFDRAQTRTPAFQRWFKNSKVVDAKGRPLIVFHGTNKDLTEFNTVREAGAVRNNNWFGQLGSWFAAPQPGSEGYEEGSAEATADVFAEMRGDEGSVVYPAYLSIQNPYEIEGYEALTEERDDAGGAAAFRARLVSQGYDGVVVRESDTDGGQYRDDWVAFYPTQIKSAIGNSGDFAADNPDITKSADRQIDSPEFKRDKRFNNAAEIWRELRNAPDPSGQVVFYSDTFEPVGPDERAVFARVDGRVVGYVLSDETIPGLRKNTLAWTDIEVAANWRRMGIGTELYARAMDAAKSEGKRFKMSSKTADGRKFFPRAMDAYESRGDQDSGEFSWNPDIRRSADRTPLGFYSALARGLQDAPIKSAPAGAWKTAIKGLLNKGAVKADEVEWTGINDWLDLEGQPKPVYESGYGLIDEHQNEDGTWQQVDDLGAYFRTKDEAESAITDELRQASEKWAQKEGVKSRITVKSFDNLDLGKTVTPKITKEQVAQYLEQGGVRVEESVLGGGGDPGYVGNLHADQSDSGDWYVVDDENRVIEGPFENEVDADAAMTAGRSAAATKYGQYTLPGGENYREVLLTLPGVDAKTQRLLDEERYLVLSPEDQAKVDAAKKKAGVQYRSSHWDQPNVLAHIRVNDRTDADGNRVLFVEELQSDWGQEGKRRGFDEVGKGWSAKKDEDGRWDIYDARGEYHSTVDASSEAAAIGMIAGRNGAIPSAPFVTKTEGWLNLALKRVMVMAAEGGYDKVAFVNGEQSAERYDLSKQVDEISWRPASAENRATVTIKAGGRDTVGLVDTATGVFPKFESGSFGGSRLDEVVGKEIADKILAAKSGTLSGEGLKVGGEGMKTFYDTIVPTTLKKLLPKLGGGQMATVGVSGKVSVTAKKMGTMLIPGYSKDAFLQQPGFDVTDAMREKVAGGVPLFSPDRAQTETPEFKGWFGNSKVVNGIGRPRVVYHGTAGDFSIFDVNRAGQTYGRKGERAFFFTGRIETAESAADDATGLSTYAEKYENQGFGRVDDFYDEGYDEGPQDFTSLYNGGQNIMPVYLSLQNPLIVDARWGYGAGTEFEFGPEDPTRMIERAKREGHDGIIIRGKYRNHEQIARINNNSWLSDAEKKKYLDAIAREDARKQQTDNYFIAFRPDQIKSAIGNIGAFGQRPVTAEEAARFGMGEMEANFRQYEGDIRFSADRDYEPESTVKAYKLFRTSPREPGKLFPLFVNADKPVPMDEWLRAEEGPAAAGGKVKSKLGPLAYRPGWHAGDLPVATHIGMKAKPSDKKPTLRNPEHVWAEVMFAADVDWQEEANKRGTNAQGKLVPVKAHITDQVPEGGFYRYKTNPNMTGNWLIGGEMKVTRVLSDAEVKRINDRAGVADLPREKPLNLKALGFAVRKSEDRDSGEITIDLSADKPSRDKAKAWVAKVNEMFPRNPMNGRQRVMMFGEDDMVIFELDDSVTVPGATEVKWFQAYPLRSGNGTKGMQELQRLAAEDNMPLTLYPWDKGRVSQAALTKFYKKNGFTPIRKGGKDLVWRPEPEITKSADRPWFDDLSELKISTNYQLGDLLKTSKKLNWWDRSVGTQYNIAQKHPQFKRVFDAVQRFINDVSAYATRAADLAPTILPKLETIKDIAKSPLSAEDVKALREPIFGGTLKYTRDDEGNIIETDDVSTAGVVFTNDELRDLFGLNDRQVGLYREFRRATNKSLTDLAVSDMLRYLGTDGAGVRQRALEATNLDGALNAMVAHLDQLIEQNPQRAKVLEDSKRAIKEKAGQAIGLMARGYAPLSRFGQFTVYAVGKDGEQLYFSMFENERDANKMAREMREQYPEATVTTGTMSQESYKLFSGVTPETLALFGESLGLEESGVDAKSEVFQAYLKMAKTNRSAMKRLIQRKGIDGFSEDAGRVLAGFVYSNARQISTNLHAGEISRSASEVTDGDVKDAAIRLMEYIQNPQEEAQAIRGLLFTQFIGGSIASALVNMTQPFTMTLPYLAQFDGATGASKRMADAVTLVSRGIRNDDDLQKALKRGEELGIVSPQEVHQLMAQAQGRGSLQSGDGTKMGDAAAKVNNSMAKLGLVWGKLFSAAEQFNRRVTFIAAYKLARDQGMADPMAFAEQAIAETQGVYNKGNKPKWARGAVGGTLFTFKQYSISYVEFLRRMWGNGPEGKKAVGLALGVLFLTAGMSGLPGMDDLDDVIDGFMQRVLNRSFDSKQAKKEFFASLLGQAGAEFVMSGLSGLPGMPIDFSGRMGLGNLFPGTGTLTKKADYGRDFLEVLGPAGTLFANAGTALASLAQGEVKKAAEVLAPVAAQNALKAVDMAQMGYYRDMKGRKVVDTDGWDALAKSIGFQPRAVAQVQGATMTQTNLVGQNKLRETEIADKWARGRIERKPDLVQEAKEELADWNRKNPESKIRIDESQINKRVQEANKTKAQRIAATAPKEIRNAVKKQLESEGAQ